MDYPASSSRVARALLWAAIFCVAVAVGIFWSRDGLIPIFMTRPSINGAITFLLAVGIVLSFFHLGRLLGQARHMDRLMTRLRESVGNPSYSVEQAIDSMDSGLVSDRCTRSLEALRQRSAGAEALTLLSDADVEAEEGRGILVRYLIGVMILLGLIGTFWGVLLTVGGIQKVLESLEPARVSDATQFVSHLKDSMGGLLGGMSTAFSTSLFGLGCSVILGFVEVQTRRARSTVLSDLDRFIVTVFLPVAADQGPDTLPTRTHTLAAEPLESELHVLASQQALADNLRRLTDVMVQQSITDEKVTNSLVEIKGMLESLQQEEKLTQESIRDANRLRQNMIELTDGLGQHLERLVKETRLGRDGAEVIGRGLLDRIKLEGEITNKTLSMGFSDLVRKLDSKGSKPTQRHDPEEEGG